MILIITRTFDPDVLSTIALTALIATALASLSFHILESPVRVAKVLDRHRRTVIAVGLVASITGALVVIPTITNPKPSSAAVASLDITTTGFTPVPTGVDWTAVRSDYPSLPTCLGKPASDCTIVRGTGPHIMLIGDSHAGMMIPALTAVAKKENLSLSGSIHLACPWQRDLYALPAVVPQQRMKACQEAREDTYNRVIPELKPDIVVVMNQSYEDPAYGTGYLGPDRQALQNGSPEYNSWLEQTTTDSLAQLRADGRKVVIIEPAPRRPTRWTRSIVCLKQPSWRSAGMSRRPNRRSWSSCTGVSTSRTTTCGRSTSIASCARTSRSATR